MRVTRASQFNWLTAARLCLALVFPVLGQTDRVVAQGLITSCGPVEGDWAWSTGGVVTITWDGRALWAPQEGAAPAFEGAWVCDGATQEIQITWPQGVTDSLRLADDQQNLAGRNQLGVAITATRPQAPEPPKAAGPVPPAWVGTWLLEIWLPTPQGPIPVVWHIRPDGSYDVEAGELSHSGKMTAFDGKWQLEADTSDHKDQGSYQFQNWATLMTQGTLGPGRWHRKAPNLRLEMSAFDEQQLPTGLPALVTQAQAIAAGWRPDAELVSVNYERPDSNNLNAKPELKLRYRSPATGAGLVVSASPEGSGFFVHDVVNWGGEEIPDGFLDLPAVWSIARQHGLLPPLDRAGLRIWRPQQGDPVLAWTLSSARGETRGINLDAADGNKLDGDLSGYIATYNAQWQAAIAGLKRLFQQPRRSSSYSDFSDWGSSSSSDYGSDDDSGSSSSSHDGAQSAWSSGDSAAYDRIMSGTPTWSDCTNHGAC